jgi:hypothetical protein
MFRFTIRELLLATLAVGMGLTWSADRSRLHAALASSKEEAALSERVCERLRSQIDRIGDQLPAHGLYLWWACGVGPIVGEPPLNPQPSPPSPSPSSP